MKLGMNIFCPSPASTAIRSSSRIEEDSPHSISNHTQIHGNVHESYNSSITPRLIRVLSSPCSSSSDLALNPKPVRKHEYKQLQEQKISDSRKSRISSCCGADSDMASYEHQRRRKSSADGTNYVNASAGTGSDGKYRLLLDRPPSDSGSKAASAALVKQLERRISRRPVPVTMMIRSSGNDSDSPKLKSSSGYHRRSTDKIVVLWVSLHCKGCEAKVRKHISKMEGVKSFSTDWVTKRVTIISNMDPHDVLASVSTVKYAQFWPSSSSSSSSYHHTASSASSSASAAPLFTLIR
ncbi:hypothetical protein QQ045_028067 [Rhodiola kirilowii]